MGTLNNSGQIIVNITDQIPASNTATIDKDGLVGNTYSKDQFDQRFDDKIDAIQNMVESKFQGTINPSDPSPIEDGTYKPEISSAEDKPSDPTSTVDWGRIYVNAGGLRAKEGYETLFYKVGTVWKKSETKIPDFHISPSFDKTSSSKAQGGKQIAEWLGVIKKSIPETFGITQIGGSSSSMGGVDGSFISNIKNKATKDITIKSVVTNFSTGGAFKVAITSAQNTVIYTSPEYTAASGSQTTLLPDLQLQADQTIWLVTTLNSTASIKWSNTGAVGNNFIQKPPTGNIVSGSAGSYYSFYFNAETYVQDGILDGYLHRSEAEAYEDLTDLTSYSSASRNTTIGQQPQTAIYILKVPFTAQKVIKELIFTCNLAGTMKFVIGDLDQANKFIQDREFSVNVVVGINNILVDQLLKAGQYIGVKTPGLMPDVNTVLSHNYSWAVEGSYTNSLTAVTAWSLGLSFKAVTRVLNDNSFARQSQINNLQGQIENFQPSDIRTSPDGTKWKLGVSNAGATVWTAVGRYTKVLHFGNSILKHDIVSYWWGNWGMAAKTRNDDYEHRFLTKLKVANPTAASWSQNIATWEQNPSGFNKASLDTLLTAQTYDLIILRLGENATSVATATYKNEFRNLITYIQAKVPTARIIIGGMFWSNAGLDSAMQQIAIEKNLTYVDMSGLDISANKSFIGDIVQGDDGQSHSVNNAGVANHPNNAGMEAIAARLFNAANS